MKSGGRVGRGGGNRLLGSRNSMCKGPEMLLSLKKWGESKEGKMDECSSKALNSKPKPYSKLIAHSAEVTQSFSTENLS